MGGSTICALGELPLRSDLAATYVNPSSTLSEAKQFPVAARHSLLIAGRADIPLEHTKSEALEAPPPLQRIGLHYGVLPYWRRHFMILPAPVAATRWVRVTCFVREYSIPGGLLAKAEQS
ncbi:hypothetical protein XH98_35910 [Bradyrhizobium sp. CCBAU 51745]|nr:hypothetical protein [Bradyrhizobium sp. CCBAU 51745]